MLRAYFSNTEHRFPTLEGIRELNAKTVRCIMHPNRFEMPVQLEVVEANGNAIVHGVGRSTIPPVHGSEMLRSFETWITKSGAEELLRRINDQEPLELEGTVLATQQTVANPMPPIFRSPPSTTI